MPANDTLASQSLFVTAADAIDDLARGRFLVVADSEQPDSEADVMIAAAYASADAINFLASEARGVIYLGLTDERCDELQLGPMTEEADPHSWKSAFAVMIDARHGISTGISAHDRARTVAAAIDPRSDVEDLVRPGHIVPLRARPGGLLTRAGRTESFVDLPRMAGRVPAGVASSVMRDDGSMASVADLVPWCRQHGIRMLSVASAAAEAVRRLPWLERRAERRLATPDGDVAGAVFAEPYSGDEHIAVLGRRQLTGRSPRVAAYGLCVAGHALGDRDCTERPRLADAMRDVATGDLDVLVHLGVRGFCCRDAEGQPASSPEHEALARRPWPVIAKVLAELGVESVDPSPGPPRAWAELKEYGLYLTSTIGRKS